MKTKLLAFIFSFCWSLIAFSQTPYISYNFPNGNCSPARTIMKLENSPQGAFNYNWYFSDNQSFQTQVNTDTVSHYFVSGYHYAYCDVYDSNWNYLYGTYEYVSIPGASLIYTTPYDGKACPGDEMEFYINYQGSGDSYSWDFGDGSSLITGNSNNVNHTYISSGLYTVTCIANFSGCPSSTLTTVADINLSVPIAIPPSFGVNPDSACIGDNVGVNFPTHVYNSFFIDFGDGYTSTSAQSHAYNYLGSFPVAVSVTNGCGFAATLYDTVHVVNNLQVLSTPYFNTNAGNHCPNTITDFWGPNGYSNYNWNFGNGQTSTLQNPDMTFTAAGPYNVSLTVTNGCGMSNSYTDIITISSNIPIGAVNITAPDSVCPGDPVLISINAQDATNFFVDNGSGDWISYVDNDGNMSLNTTYNSTGIYNVQVYAQNGCGNFNSNSQNIEVVNNAPLDANGWFFDYPMDNACAADTVFMVISPATFPNMAVDFGDGSPVKTQPDKLIFGGPNGGDYAVFKHKYATTGVFAATATVTNNCGNSGVKNSNIVVSTGASMEDAGIFYDETHYNCMQDPIEFLAYGGSKYTWDFGDGTPNYVTNEILPSIEHKYPYAGLYNLTVKVENGCGLSDTIKQAVNIEYSEIYVTTNQVSSSCGQSNGKAIAVVTYAVNSPVSYSWTNGDKLAIADTVSAGLYEVTVTDSRGCQTRAIATVSDAQAPTITLNAIVNVSCYGGNNGAIDINLIGGASPYTYQWSNGATTQDVNNLSYGPYEVIVTDANGCKATKSFVITQPNSFNATFQIKDANCNAPNGQIITNVQPAGTYYYVWNTGHTTPTVNFIQAGVYHLSLVDYNGCLNDYDVIVNNIGGPIVAVDSISSINCSTGGNYISTINYSPGSSGPFTYLWTPGNYTTPDISNVPAGFYTLMTTGNGNCKTFTTVNIQDQAMQLNPICIVTVDTTTQTNQLVWQEKPQSNLESFNIYRESSQAGLYYKVGNVHKDSAHIFVDPVADPSVRGWRYKISAVSDCGSESFLSPLHKTIHLTVNKGLGSNYNLIWDDYIGHTYSTFYIWRWTNNQTWTIIDTVPSTVLSYTDQDPILATVTDLNYMIEAGPVPSCDPSRGAINTTRSNIKTAKTSQTTGIITQPIVGSIIRVYPNPSSGVFTLSFEKSITVKGILEIFNPVGELVLREEIGQNATSSNYDLSEMDNGIYLVRFTSPENTSVAKLILNK